MQEEIRKNEFAKNLVQGLIDKGDMQEDIEGNLVLTRAPNLVGNAADYTQ